MSSERQAKPVEILLVEDNEADAKLTEEVLRKAKILNKINVVTDGEQALNFLRREGEFADAQIPDMVLLDLNLPKKNGREVLEEMRTDPDLKAIPVVVLTTSSDDNDILESYQNGANCYVTKPVDLNQFRKVVEKLDQFWFTVVEFPPRPST